IAEIFKLDLVQFLERVEAATARVAVHSPGVADVENRLPRCAALHSLKNRRKETASPRAFAPRRVAPPADHHDETGEVLVFRAQAVSDPRTHRRTAEPRRARKEHQVGRGMIEL